MLKASKLLLLFRSRLVTGLAPLSLGGQRRLVSAAWLVEEAGGIVFDIDRVKGFV